MTSPTVTTSHTIIPITQPIPSPPTDIAPLTVASVTPEAHLMMTPSPPPTRAVVLNRWTRRPLAPVRGHIITHRMDMIPIIRRRSDEKSPRQRPLPVIYSACYSTATNLYNHQHHIPKAPSCSVSKFSQLSTPNK